MFCEVSPWRRHPWYRSWQKHSTCWAGKENLRTTGNHRQYHSRTICAFRRQHRNWGWCWINRQLWRKPHQRVHSKYSQQGRQYRRQWIWWRRWKRIYTIETKSIYDKELWRSNGSYRAAETLLCWEKPGIHGRCSRDQAKMTSVTVNSSSVQTKLESYFKH